MRGQLQQLMRGQQQGQGQQPGGQQQGQQGQQGKQGQGQGQGQQAGGQQPGQGQGQGQQGGGRGTQTAGGLGGGYYQGGAFADRTLPDGGNPERTLREASRDLAQLRQTLRDNPELAREMGDIAQEIQRMDFSKLPQGPELEERLRRQVMPNIETLVEVSLSEKNGGTELHMKHSGFPAAAAREGHSQGWNSTLNRLNDYLDPQGMAGTITLLGDVRSSYTRTARMALAEKSVAYTMQAAAPHSPDILAVHPFGRIPALRDGGIDIFETAAIVTYLDETFETGPSLRPDTIMGRTRCAQWISAVNSYLYDTMVRRYLLQVFFPKGEGRQPDRAVIGKALSEMPAQLAALEQAYANGDWLAGNALSAADLFVAPILAGLQLMPEGGKLIAGCPNVMRAQEVIRQRASFAGTNPATSSR